MMAESKPDKKEPTAVELTKREAVASICLAGLLARPKSEDLMTADERVQCSVSYADKLMDELKKP